MGVLNDYHQYDGLGLAELVKKGEVKPVELVQEAIERIEKHNPQLNAVIHKMYDIARRTTEGPLPGGPFQGVPFLLKEISLFYLLQLSLIPQPLTLDLDQKVFKILLSTIIVITPYSIHDVI